jgi:hypothetical protein
MENVFWRCSKLGKCRQKFQRQIAGISLQFLCQKCQDKSIEHQQDKAVHEHFSQKPEANEKQTIAEP